MSFDVSSLSDQLHVQLVRLDQFAHMASAMALGQVAPVAGGGAAAPAAPAPQGGGGGGAGGGGGGMTSLLLPILIFVGFYFFLIRPGQKKQQDLEANLKKGDKVLTTGGIAGKIVELRPRRAILEIAPNVRIEILRGSISGMDEGDAPAPAKADEKPADVKK